MTEKEVFEIGGRNTVTYWQDENDIWHMVSSLTGHYMSTEEFTPEIFFDDDKCDRWIHGALAYMQESETYKMKYERLQKQNEELKEQLKNVWVFENVCSGEQGFVIADDKDDAIRKLTNVYPNIWEEIATENVFLHKSDGKCNGDVYVTRLSLSGKEINV